MTRISQGLCCALVLLLCGAVRAEEGKTFRYKENARQIYQTTSKMDQTQTVGEQKIVTSMKQTSVDITTFEAADDGNLQTRHDTRQLAVKVKIDPVGEYDFDSKSNERDSGTVLSEALNPIYERLSLASITVTLTPRGEIKAVEGIKELLGDLLKNNELGAELAGGGTEEAAKLALADRFIVFSEEPVAPGETWETRFDVTLPGIGKTTGKRIHTYVGPDKVGETATEKFTFNHELSLNLDVSANGTQIRGMLSTTGSSGTVQFDAEKGQIVSMKNSYTIGGDVTVTANGMSQTISSSQTQTTEHVLLDKLPE